ncbi:MAG: division/cell wall cluster transcriptional repressor MraZ [Clostridia bacterium]|nr:division/cell wall cluster transcriptional repressor MraZ [Clostridia bacterium]MBQ8289844.1 division/cell wall cluster transcriptional repressor MraZ [Clostridia bacterium]
MSFVGHYTHTLDAKKRVFIPAKYREELGSEFYITRKFDPYLSIYTAKDWAEFVDKIASLPETVAHELQDFILGAAQKCVVDASGRIVLDEDLMKHAKIDKTVVFSGAGHNIRIWAEDVWLEREEKRDLEDLRRRLEGFGL